MTNHCPNCGVAGLNLNCNLHFMPMFGNMTNPCKEIPLPIIDRTQAQDREKDLLAEIGRLSLQLRAAELQAHTLQAKLSDLEADGIIDQMGRKLPLPDHHKDCPHGQNGWAVCTCEELKARDVKLKQAEDGWKACDQDAYGNRQYMCLKCHYVTEWVKDHSELASVKEHVCSSPIDRAFDDMKETKPTRDPRQDLKPGDHVRFEIEGIIKERQSAGIFEDENGNDFEPIQYAVKDSINGMTYYVGYHQITKKLGSME